MIDLLESLLAEGLFDRTYRAPGHAWVRLWLGRWSNTLYWERVPVMEKLVERVRTNGELLSLVRTPGSPLDQLRATERKAGGPKQEVPHLIVGHFRKHFTTSVDALLTH